MQEITCRSCKYSQNVEHLRLFNLEIIVLFSLANKEIEGVCCLVLSPPQIVKVMQFLCEMCNKKNVEVVNTLKMLSA